jgi:hypothetical protein
VSEYPLRKRLWVLLLVASEFTNGKLILGSYETSSKLVLNNIPVLFMTWAQMISAHKLR